jgi:hypothetical protein
VSPADDEEIGVRPFSDYAIIWFTEQCLSNILRLETYVQDAERDGDNELVEFFPPSSVGEPSERGTSKGPVSLTSPLAPDAVREFLRAAGEEGVTWEAKADDKRGRLHRDSLRKAACGFANRDGGYVIVGAKRDADMGEWSLPGITKPDEEPELWIGRVLRSLRPSPRFEPQMWKLDDDRIAGVVWAELVEEPPCMPPQGQVIERVSGETLPVTNPCRLDALYRGGQQARGRAAHFANQAARRALDEPQWFSQRAVGVAMALASVAARRRHRLAPLRRVVPRRRAVARAARRPPTLADDLAGGYGSAQLAVRVDAAPDLPRSMPPLRDGAAVERPPPPPREAPTLSGASSISSGAAE